MKLLVGLGNPGPQYETTRHNAGFLMLDLLAEAEKLSWSDDSTRFGGHIAKGKVMGVPAVLLKPMVYMNRSGRSVGAVMRFFKIAAPDMIVFHDDIDVPGGKVKAREGGGHGGHNGIRSIIEETGESAFHRIKIGVGRPNHPGAASEQAVSNWVLGRMTDAELDALQNEMLKDVQVRLKGIFDKDASRNKNDG
jgi:PTH1 family peptidyl-tRNA hydrolase